MRLKMIGSLLMTCATSLASSGIAEPLAPKEESAAVCSTSTSINVDDYALIYSYKPVTILESEDEYAYVEQKVYKLPYTERSNRPSYLSLSRNRNPAPSMTPLFLTKPTAGMATKCNGLTSWKIIKSPAPSPTTSIAIFSLRWTIAPPT